MKDDHAIAAGETYSFALNDDFREVISVEYPISQQPPVYLLRKNRLDPDFYSVEGFYDIDHDYATGKGWYIYVSGAFTVGQHTYIQYLANHNTAMLDDSTVVISVPDEYESILIAQVICRGYRERLGATMIDPTAQTSIVLQMTDMVQKAEDNYNALVARAQQKLADSKITPHHSGPAPFS